MGDAKFSIPKLNGTNWQTWKVRVEMLLARDDLWYVIEEPVFAEEDRTEQWKKDDRKAKATIILLLEDSQFSLVKNCVLARDTYEALKRYHQKTTRSVRVSLLKKLCAVNLAENSDVEEHLREFDDLFDRLDAAGTTLDKDTKICMLLRSLPPSFDGLVTALDSRADDDISLDVVKSKLVDEYNRQLERRGGSVGSERAMRSTEGKSGGDPRICHFCKNVGHIKRNCCKFLATLKEEADTPCTSCGECGKAKTAQNDTRSVAFTVGEENFKRWVIDSGASSHMCSDRSCFESLREFSGGNIILADGKTSQVQGEGQVVVHGVDGSGETVKINMNKVKFVPGLSTNLISVGQLVQKGFKVSFANATCGIVNADGEVVATGSQHGKLYYLNIAQVSLAATDDRSHR
ncbi:hypothetical protein RP20_CCG016837 [Aedes albopictus]|nr:hypothetical protein RP20_CCG016837 [Aedes albopictus]